MPCCSIGCFGFGRCVHPISNCEQFKEPVKNGKYRQTLGRLNCCLKDCVHYNLPDGSLISCQNFQSFQFKCLVCCLLVYLWYCKCLDLVNDTLNQAIDIRFVLPAAVYMYFSRSTWWCFDGFIYTQTYHRNACGLSMGFPFKWTPPMNQFQYPYQLIVFPQWFRVLWLIWWSRVLILDLKSQSQNQKV